MTALPVAAPRGSVRSRGAALLALVFLGVLLLPSSAQAARRAFLVGVDKYPNFPPAQQLTRAVADAGALATLLRQMGFDDVRQYEDLSRPEFNEKWQDFLLVLKPEDEIVFFFSGHGVGLEGSDYLQLGDHPGIRFDRRNQLRQESLAVDDLLSALDPPRKVRIALVILDACRTNPFIPPEYAKAGAGGDGGVGYTLDPPVGAMILFSAGRTQSSLDRLSNADSDPHSVYMRKLLPLLLAKQSEPIQTIAVAVRKQVAQLAKAHGKGPQHPAYSDGILGNYCLGGCAEEGDYGTTLATLMEHARIADIDTPEASTGRWETPNPALGMVGGIFYQRNDDGPFVLEEDVRFTDSKGEHWSAPKGIVITNSTFSPPALAVWGDSTILGELRAPAALVEHYAETRERSWKGTYQMYYEALLASGVPTGKAKILYASVSKFGPRW